VGATLVPLIVGSKNYGNRSPNVKHGNHTTIFIQLSP